MRYNSAVAQAEKPGFFWNADTKMPEPVSMMFGGLCLGLAAATAHARGSSAVSDESLTVTKAAAAVIARAEKSEAIYGQKSAVISQLFKLVQETQETDGGIVDVIQASAAIAKDFIQALSPQMPLPELAIDPDGAVSMDWIASRHRMFSMSISQRSRLSFAWLDGTNRGHGVVAFDRCQIPRQVTELVQSICNP